MLHHLAERLPFPPWSLLKYTTFRAAGALVTALVISLVLGPRLIRWLRDLRYRQEYTPKDLQAGSDGSARAADAAKRGTPTMGGLLIVIALDVAVLFWARWNPLVILVLVTLVILAGLGFYDDWQKVSRQDAAGVPGWLKLAVQLLVALGVVACLWWMPSTRPLVTEIHLPFVPARHALLQGGWGMGLAAMLVVVVAIVGSSNAVNLTDGMDGLAIGCTLICAAVFAVLTYLAGNRVLAEYLLIPRVPGAGELTVVCAALIGASLGFLWFNCHPAEVFMGDTGSLALGGVLGVVAVAIHQPLVLLIAGGVFVVEAGSVMLQVGWFKYTRLRHGAGRRILRMSPLHHHFRKLGWAESRIVTRFYIAALLCAVLALSTLKIR